MEVRQLPEAAVVGAAVADLTHLLAELVENAAQFSPPHTRVRVTGEPVGERLRRRDRGPRPRHGQGDARRGQPAHRAVRGPRPVRQRPARPLRGQPARGPARHQGAPAAPRPTAAPPRSCCCPRHCCRTARRNVPPPGHDTDGPPETASTRACRPPRSATPSRPSPIGPRWSHRDRAASEEPANGSRGAPPPGERSDGDRASGSRRRCACTAPPDGPEDSGDTPAPGPAGAPRPPTARTAFRGADGTPGVRRRTTSAHPNSYGTAWPRTGTAGHAAAAGHPASEQPPAPKRAATAAKETAHDPGPEYRRSPPSGPANSTGCWTTWCCA